MLNAYLVVPMIGSSVPLSLLTLLGMVFVGVLVADSIGNFITFHSRLVNAIVTALVATAIVFGISALLDVYSDAGMDRPVIFAGVAILVFIADFIGNHIAFKSRIVNALVTSIVATMLVAGLVYMTNPTAFTAGG
jgi:hypothetical protein